MRQHDDIDPTRSLAQNMHHIAQSLEMIIAIPIPTKLSGDRLFIGY